MSTSKWQSKGWQTSKQSMTQISFSLKCSSVLESVTPTYLRLTVWASVFRNQQQCSFGICTAWGRGCGCGSVHSLVDRRSYCRATNQDKERVKGTEMMVNHFKTFHLEYHIKKKLSDHSKNLPQYHNKLLYIPDLNSTQVIGCLWKPGITRQGQCLPSMCERRCMIKASQSLYEVWHCKQACAAFGTFGAWLRGPRSCFSLARRTASRTAQLLLLTAGTLPCC